MDRHRFAEPVRGFHTRRFNYVGVTKIMDFLLKGKTAPKAQAVKIWQIHASAVAHTIPIFGCACSAELERG